MSSVARIEDCRNTIRNATNIVFEYHRGCDALRAWPWPTTMEARVTPSALLDHRISHRMLGPCCLCPMMDAMKPDFVEAAIYMASDGDNAGKYVATCAKDECGYFVPLEKFYDKQSPVRSYARRAFGERIPQRVTPIGRTNPASTSRPLKRSYAMMDINADTIVQAHPPLRRKARRTTELMAKLDARVKPGISGQDFHMLFYKCECGLYMTRRAFMDHDCLNEVIDLTDDN